MAAPSNPKEFLVKAKLYRFASYMFLAIGIVAFGMLYVKNLDGRLMDALREPSTILIFVMPFLPAIILSLLGIKADKKYRELSKK